MVRANRIVLRPHDVGNKVFGSTVIHHEVHRHVIDPTLEVPNLKNDVTLSVLLPDAIWFEQPNPSLHSIVVPDRQQATTTGAGAFMHLSQGKQQVIVVKKMRDGIVARDHHVELSLVVGVDRPHVAD